MVCPLCLSERNKLFYSDKRRDYLRCDDCLLVFVPQSFHLSSEAERAEYDKHENHPEDEGYRNFLSRVATPLLDILPQNAQGLDFGCGPGPVLSSMFIDKGYFVELYDQFYFPSKNVLKRQYDFITATEVLEHLREPRGTLAQLWSCLKKGGYFAVMTKLVLNQEAFSRWHYKNDPTHIIYFSIETFEWLAKHLGAELVYQEKDVSIFKKYE